jgi:thiamine pyrophosphate-dependent acetolactate synthase large subunit-like protein
MEITTAVRHDMDVTVIVLDNSELGKISKEQRAGAFDVWQTGLVNPDFAAFARSCGAMGLTVARTGELDDALAEALSTRGPALVHVHADVGLL